MIFIILIICLKILEIKILPEQIKNLRRQSHEKLNASMNGGRNNTGYTPQNMKKKSTTPRT